MCVCGFRRGVDGVVRSRLSDQPSFFDGALRAYRGSEELRKMWSAVVVPSGVESIGVVRRQAKPFDYPAVTELLRHTQDAIASGDVRSWMPHPSDSVPHGIISRQQSTEGETDAELGAPSHSAPDAGRASSLGRKSAMSAHAPDVEECGAGGNVDERGSGSGDGGGGGDGDGEGGSGGVHNRDSRTWSSDSDADSTCNVRRACSVCGQEAYADILPWSPARVGVLCASLVVAFALGSLACRVKRV